MKLLEDLIVYARYLYRPYGQSSDMGPWAVLLTYACGNTPAGHTAQIKKFNRRDAGRYIWRWEYSCVGEIDYPTGAIHNAITQAGY